MHILPQCPICKTKDAKAHKSRYRCKQCDSLLKRFTRYNIHPAEFMMMLKKQKNKCKICGCGFTKENPPCVDHCHGSGSVRGLLCRSCNCLLGYAKDNIKILKNCVVYLDEYKRSSS